ncbi:MAG: PAS domain S-box protein [Candidatus Hodarchaeota archaeon]
MARILLVDDDKDLVAVAINWLTREDQSFHITTTASGQQALKKIANESLPFDIIVADYQMPGMDGLELLERVRQQGTRIPFIIFTGKGREEVAMRALNLGADYYLTKEGEPKSLYGELAHIINTLIRHKRTEEAFLQSESRYRDTFEAIPDPAYLWERQPDGHVIMTQANRAAHKLTRGRIGILIGERLERLAEDEKYVKLFAKAGMDSSKIAANVLHVMETGKGIQEEIQYGRQEGEETIALLTDYVKAGDGLVLVITKDISDLRRGEKELKRTEQEYRDLVENINQVIYTTDEKGILTYVSPSMEAAFGFSPSEIIGRPFSEFVHPGDLQKTMKRFQKAMSGITKPTELRSLVKSGDYRWIRTHSKPIFVKNRFVGVRGAITDIHEQKMIEEALRESEDRFRILSQASSEGIVIHDKGIILASNEIYAAKLGYKLSEVIGSSGLEHVAPDYRQLVLEHILSGSEKQIDAMALRKDGTIFPARIIGKKAQYQGQDVRVTVLRDISEQKATEEILSRRNEIEKLVSTISTGFINLTADEIDTGINYSLELLGEFIDVDWFSLFLFSEDGKKFSCTNTWTAKKTDSYQDKLQDLPAEDFSWIIEQFDRKKVVIIPSTSELLDKMRNAEWYSFIESIGIKSFVLSPLIRGRTLIGFLFFASKSTREWGSEDINLLKMAGETFTNALERRKAEKQLRHQKEELSEFAHAMAHDLRNYLLSIQGFADLLSSTYNQDYAKKISQLAQDMNELLFRSVSLADAGLIAEKTDEVNLSQLVQSAAETVIPQNIRFIQKDLPIVSGDYKKLLEVFQNLFENAVTHGNPTIIEVKPMEVEDGVNILVSNDGNPIPPEHRHEVFSRHFTTKEDGGGLGLAIAQKIINAHGWMIKVEDSAKTTFSIFIPDDL